MSPGVDAVELAAPSPPAYVSASTATPTAAAPVVAVTPNSTIISYPAAFFAPSLPTTALEIVRLIPGFTFDGGGALRGYGPAAGNVLIDGSRPASKDDRLDEILRRLPASEIERVDVIRGGAPGIDMQGKTVIANLVRKTTPGGSVTLTGWLSRAADGRVQPVARAEAEYRAHDIFWEGSASFSGLFDDGAGFGRKIRTDQFGALTYVGQEAQKGLLDVERLATALEAPALGGKLRLSASLAALPYRETTLDTLSAPVGEEDDDYHQNQTTLELGARLQKPLGSRISSETVLLEQLGSGDIDDVFAASPNVAAATGDDTSDLFHEHKRRGETIASTKIQVDFTPNYSLNVGIEGAYNWLTTATSFIENGVPMKLPAADVHVTEARTEAFALVDARPAPTVNLELGGKIEASRIVSTGDVNAAQTLVYPKPRAVVTWSPTPVDQLRLRVEREVGQLNFDDYTANAGYIATGDVRAGNPRLTPQQDWVFEAVAEHRFWSAADFSVTGRHYDLTDVIDRVEQFGPSGPYDAPGNIGDGRREEVAFALTVPLDRLGLSRAIMSGQTTFRWSRVIDPLTGLPRPISGLHSNDWELHFTQGLPNLKSTWGFDAIGPTIENNYRFDELDSDKVGAYLTSFFEYKPKLDLSFRLEIRNLLNRDVEHSRLVYEDVRTTSPLDFDELRRLHAGRFVFVRVVKTLR